VSSAAVAAIWRELWCLHRKVKALALFRPALPAAVPLRDRDHAQVFSREGKIYSPRSRGGVMAGPNRRRRNPAPGGGPGRMLRNNSPGGRDSAW